MISVSFHCRNSVADSPTSILPQMTQQRKPATLIPLPLPETGSGPGRCQTIRADGMGGELAQGSGKEQPLSPFFSSSHLAGCEQGCMLLRVRLAAILRP